MKRMGQAVVLEPSPKGEKLAPHDFAVPSSAICWMRASACVRPMLSRELASNVR
jgi:hypothetical protein